MTIRYDTMNYIYMRPKADGRQLNLPHVTKEQNSNEETKNQNQMLRRNGPVLKSVQSVLGPEWSLRWERFVKALGFKRGMKE